MLIYVNFLRAQGKNTDYVCWCMDWCQDTATGRERRWPLSRQNTLQIENSLRDHSKKKKSLLRTGKRRQGQLSHYIQASYQQFFYALSIPCPDLLLLGMLFPSIQRCLKSCHNTGWEIFLLLLSHALNSKGNLAEGKMVIPRQFQELLYCQVEK